MKKSYLTLAAMAMIMASCSNEVLIDNEDGQTDVAIGFSTFSDKATKAITDADLEFYHQTFSVYGTKVAKNGGAIDYVFGASAATVAGNKAGTTVTFDANNTTFHNWVYSPARYWDKQADYSFVAFAPASAPLALSYENVNNQTKNPLNNIVTTGIYSLIGQNLQEAESKNAEILTGFTGADDTDTDIMVSAIVEEDGATHHEDVNLVFKHILAKLNVTFAKDASLNDADVVIKSVKVENLFNAGTYSNNAYKEDPYVSGWANVGYSANPSTYVLSYNAANATTKYVTLGDDAAKSYFIESIVMPQDIPANSNLTVSYSITTKDTKLGDHTENFTYVVDIQPSFVTFNDRYNYNLNFTIKPTLITFDADCAGWEHSSTSNPNIF